MSDLRLDHIIYAVPDLEEAAARFRDEFGLGSLAGGRHPGWGTANRIVPLGHEYVELVAAVDPDEAAASEFGRPVMEAIGRGQRLVGWAVATDDLDGIATRLNLEVGSGSRTRPDGSILGWRLAGVRHALTSHGLPFFIEWSGPAELHPGAATVEHRVTPRGIGWVEIAARPESLHEWLGDHDLPVRTGEGPPSLSAVAISTVAGELVLR
jgi:catechol 2,3-dioxygenase-like lactoylglutathione lyase family enzyme